MSKLRFTDKNIEWVINFQGCVQNNFIYTRKINLNGKGAKSIPRFFLIVFFQKSIENIYDAFKKQPVR